MQPNLSQTGSSGQELILKDLQMANLKVSSMEKELSMKDLVIKDLKISHSNELSMSLQKARREHQETLEGEKQAFDYAQMQF